MACVRVPRSVPRNVVQCSAQCSAVQDRSIVPPSSAAASSALNLHLPPRHEPGTRSVLLFLRRLPRREKRHLPQGRCSVGEGVEEGLEPLAQEHRSPDALRRLPGVHPWLVYRATRLPRVHAEPGNEKSRLHPPREKFWGADRPCKATDVAAEGVDRALREADMHGHVPAEGPPRRRVVSRPRLRVPAHARSPCPADQKLAARGVCFPLGFEGCA